MQRILLISSFTILLVAAIPLFAHHSFPATYFEEQSITVQGELQEFEYKSPHAWVHVLVKDSAGQVQRFSAEWANPSRLGQQNINKDTFKVGDFVIISGSPGRNSERTLHLKAIERPEDGWKWPARQAKN